MERSAVFFIFCSRKPQRSYQSNHNRRMSMHSGVLFSVSGILLGLALGVIYSPLRARVVAHMWQRNSPDLPPPSAAHPSMLHWAVGDISTTISLIIKKRTQNANSNSLKFNWTTDWFELMTILSISRFTLLQKQIVDSVYVHQKW